MKDYRLSRHSYSADIRELYARLQKVLNTTNKKEFPLREKLINEFEEVVLLHNDMSSIHYSLNAMQIVNEYAKDSLVQLNEHPSLYQTNVLKKEE